MSLADLNSVRAVHQAMDECDELGQAAFLDKYGFRRARRFFVQRGNQQYDSKAICGAAHGYQFPEHGPLSPNDFSGGEDTVQPKLEALGFKMVVLPKDSLSDHPPEQSDLSALE